MKSDTLSAITREFIDMSLVDGLTDYYLTSLESAADFVLAIDESKLKISPNEFRDRLERVQYVEFLKANKVVTDNTQIEENGAQRKLIGELLWERDSERWEKLQLMPIEDVHLRAEIAEMTKRYRELSELVGEMCIQKTASFEGVQKGE